MNNIDSNIHHRDSSIDLLRGFAIIFMIAGHIGFGTYCNSVIHAFHMPLFYFVSGLVFRPNKYNSFKQLMAKLIRLLIIPYVVVALFHLVIQIIMDLITYGKIVNLAGYLLQIFWVNNNEFPISGALWFLTSLFAVKIIAYLELRVLKQKIYALILSIVVFFALTPIYVYNYHIPWSFATAAAGVMFFMGGYCCWDYKDLIGRIKLYWMIVGITLTLVVIYYNGEVNLRKCLYGNSSLLFVLVAIVLILVSFSISIKVVSANLTRILKRITNYIVDIGKNSIIYMCINALVIRIVRIPFALISIERTSLITIVINFAVFAVSLPLMYLLAALINKTPIRYLFHPSRKEISSAKE